MNLKNIFFNALLSWGEEASGVGGVVVLGRAVRIADLGRQLPQTLEFLGDLPCPWYLKCEFLFSTLHEGIHCNCPDGLTHFS